MSKKLKRLKREKMKIQHIPPPTDEQKVAIGMGASVQSVVACEFCGEIKDIKFGKCRKTECMIARVRKKFPNPEEK